MKTYYSRGAKIFALKKDAKGLTNHIIFWGIRPRVERALIDKKGIFSLGPLLLPLIFCINVLF